MRKHKPHKRKTRHEMIRLKCVSITSENPSNAVIFPLYPGILS